MNLQYWRYSSFYMTGQMEWVRINVHAMGNGHQIYRQTAILTIRFQQQMDAHDKNYFQYGIFAWFITIEC